MQINIHLFSNIIVLLTQLNGKFTSF